MILGRVAGAHGVRGQIRVRVAGDGPDNLFRLEEVWLIDGSREEALDAGQLDEGSRFEIRSSGSGRSGEVRLGLEGVDGRDAAEALRGRWLVVPADRLAPLPDGEFYWHQLIGCRVLGTDARDVGVVIELMETGAHDVLVVEDEAGRRHLIPAADELLREIDVEAGRIVVELVPGLVETE